jgi:hypothetical protein
MVPVAVVNVTGVELNSVSVIVNSVALTTSSTKYLTEELMPPNTVPENITLISGYSPAVLVQVIRLVPAVVAVHVGVLGNASAVVNKVF